MSDISQDAERSYDRGIALLNKKQFTKAEAQFRKTLKLCPSHHGATHYLGHALWRTAQFKEALLWIDRAIEMVPGVADSHHIRGSLLKVEGRFSEARAAFERALQLRPDYPVAWYNYAGTKRFEKEDTALNSIEQLVNKPGLSNEDLDFLHFAAGKISNDVELFDRAFGHYREGNRLRSREQFSQDAHIRLAEKIQAGFSKQGIDSLAGGDVGSQSDEPIFVVGMPRSGTTLVEQILASHPQIEGAGELTDISEISYSLAKMAGGRTDLTDLHGVEPGHYRDKADFYLECREALRTNETRRVIDKMPGNFAQVGLIHCLFSNARIIHCVRDPRDCGLSCYFQRFTRRQEFSYDLNDIGFFYRLQEGLMNHWKTIFPGKIHTLHYEELIDSPESMVRDLLEFNGMDWNDACLDFHKNRRQVSTASVYQVRQPLNRRGIGRWKNYEKHLQPLLEALERFAPLATGTLKSAKLSI